MIIKYTLRANPEAHEAGVDDSVCTILDGIRSVTSQLDKDGNRYICAIFRDANTPDAMLPVVSPIYIMNDNGKTIEVINPNKLAKRVDYADCDYKLTRIKAYHELISDCEACALELGKTCPKKLWKDWTEEEISTAYDIITKTK